MKVKLTLRIIDSFLHTVFAIFSCMLSFCTRRTHLNTRPGDQTRLAVLDIISNSKSACLPRFHFACHLPLNKGKTEIDFLARKVVPSCAVIPSILNDNQFLLKMFSNVVPGNGSTFLLIIHALPRVRFSHGTQNSAWYFSRLRMTFPQKTTIREWIVN